MSNATSFGKQSATYAKGRPGYPSSLYDWVVKNSPDRQTVWDVGCGSGQATLSLANYFERVHATDISDAQIQATPAHPNIEYSAAEAHESGLPGNWADAITAATAVHWFANQQFWEEVMRVAKSGGLFCAWTYQLPIAATDIMRDFLTPVFDLIDPYWARGNRICMAGYDAENLNCPLTEIETPNLNADYEWTALQLADFAQSWSAHLRAREDCHAEGLKKLRDDFLKRFDDQKITISLPLSIFAARID
ncbi:class I SAM-dependent methyltransferase [Hellea balneolensis]|uniref:class I SAM-dependent methyltransferase n=1 Tax=Hellea balneolensis TaxID=287478 RepID=UPI000421B826|nr:class I SAM-dependent methyltransferase [Hellea balneolensis]